MMIPGKDDSICYAAKANSFVVRANGRLNKCTVALEHPNNQVGNIKEDGTVELLPQKMMMWMRGLESGNPDELGCPMHGYADPIPLAASGGVRIDAPQAAVTATLRVATPQVRTVGCEKATG